MKKRMIAVLLACTMLVSAGSAEDIHAADKKPDKKPRKEAEVKDSFEEKELPVFKGELTDDTITVRFYDAAPTVPYIGIREYYNCVMKESLDGDDEEIPSKRGSAYFLKTLNS